MPEPARGPRVVVTRPLQQAAALADAVAALGRTPVTLPLLEIAPIADPAPLAAALADLTRYALVAFVSPNAVDAALAHVRRWPDGVDIAVVGEGSRLALARHGVDGRTTRIVSPSDPAHSDSEHLLQALDPASLRGRRVLVVRGETGRELLPDALRAAGADVEAVAGYRRTLPALTPAFAATLRSLLAERNDWIITSSEALRGLVDRVRELETLDGRQGPVAESHLARLLGQRLVVPHARIADTARAQGFTELILSGSGDERLLAALQSHA